MYTFKSYVLQQKYKLNEQMLLTQEPKFVIFMVVTQEKNHDKNCYHSCISNHGMIYCYIPSSCKAQLQSQNVLKRINA